MQDKYVIEKVINKAYGEEVYSPDDIGAIDDVAEYKIEELSNIRYKAETIGEIIDVPYNEFNISLKQRFIDYYIDLEINKLFGDLNVLYIYGPPKSGKTYTLINHLMKYKGSSAMLNIMRMTPQEALIKKVMLNYKGVDLLIIDNCRNLYSIDEPTIRTLSKLVKKLVLIADSVYEIYNSVSYLRIDDCSLVDNIEQKPYNKYFWYLRTFEENGPTMKETALVLEEVFRGERQSSRLLDEYISGSFYNGALVKFIINGSPLYIANSNHINYMYSYRKQISEYIELLRVLMYFSDLTRVEDRTIEIIDGVITLKSWLLHKSIQIDLKHGYSAESLVEYIINLERM